MSAREFVARITRWFTRKRRRFIQVACVQPLAAGLTIYALDVDGRRILIGASPHAMCVLDRYPIPSAVATEGASASNA